MTHAEGDDQCDQSLRDPHKSIPGPASVASPGSARFARSPPALVGPPMVADNASTPDPGTMGQDMFVFNAIALCKNW